MLKKEEESLASLPLLARRGGDAVTDWPRPPPERLSVLGEELTVLEAWPDHGGRQGEEGHENFVTSQREDFVYFTFYSLIFFSQCQ